MEDLKPHISIPTVLGLPHNLGAAATLSATGTIDNAELSLVQCECCGLTELCTPSYIDRICTLHCGKWVCGLCEEAVKDEMGRSRTCAVSHALEAHMSMCRQFNKPEKRMKMLESSSCCEIDLANAIMRRLMVRSMNLSRIVP